MAGNSQTLQVHFEGEALCLCLNLASTRSKTLLLFFISWCFCSFPGASFVPMIVHLLVLFFVLLSVLLPLPCLARQRAAGSRELQDHRLCQPDHNQLQPRAKPLSWDSFNSLHATRRGTRLKHLPASVTWHTSGFRL